MLVLHVLFSSVILLLVMTNKGNKRQDGTHAVTVDSRVKENAICSPSSSAPPYRLSLDRSLIRFSRAVPACSRRQYKTLCTDRPADLRGDEPSHAVIL